MEDDSKAPVASDLDAAGQAEAKAYRAEAGASIRGSGALSVSPAEEAVILSADFVRWSGKVEG